jgi:hypothetical protein
MNTNKSTSDAKTELCRNKRLLTKEYLEQLDTADAKSSKLVTYEECLKMHSHAVFRYFATFTFSRAVVDSIAVTETNRLLKRFITRHFYGRREKTSNLKFLFFIEPHALQHRCQNKLHVHSLITEPTDASFTFHTANEFYKLHKISHGIKSQARRVFCFDNRSCSRISKVEVKPIEDRENLADYVLKELRRDSVKDIMSMIDVLNSDLRFYNDNCDETADKR